MPTAVTFGEIMLRLKPPEALRFTQAHTFEATYGGGEANVAVSLANFGVNARFVTALPDNDIGQACENYVRQFGVDTGHIVRKGSRLGIYFLEAGAVQRPSKVVYDRADSAVSQVTTEDINWQAAFEGADWFHWTGITPAISEGAAAVCLQAAKTAKDMGLTVSCDLNFRKKLWKWGKTAGEVMPDLVQCTDVAIGNEEDAEKVFGITAEGIDVEGGKVDAELYRSVASQLMARFPNLTKVAITLRGSVSASHNTWSAVLYDGSEMHVGPQYDIVPIVDRVGGGDSFAAGLVYSLLAGKDDQAALDFAVTASALKHTITGDFNMVSVADVEGVLKSGGGGRVQR